MYYTYAIKSEVRNYIYVGLTNNLDRRIKQHNDKKERTTRAYAPFRILFIEKFTTRTDARQKEKYLKSGAGKEYLKTLIY
ncbi:MAG: GIY-YIG nuclease family protein [Parcubacteria group bacterium]|nr:GIY-YIG nuclease family protein [Parcubacteria group bacterium]MCR4342990.1 GIY-YIG nuclease family protein [Patescibacteria group bacterium]